MLPKMKEPAFAPALITLKLTLLTQTQRLLNFSDHPADAAAGQADGMRGTL